MSCHRNILAISAHIKPKRKGNSPPSLPDLLLVNFVQDLMKARTNNLMKENMCNRNIITKFH